MNPLKFENSEYLIEYRPWVAVFNEVIVFVKLIRMI